MKLRKYVHTVVTQGGWGVSYRTGDGIDGCILNLYRATVAGIDLPVRKWLRGNGDGYLFKTTADAQQWAFDHGYLILYYRRLETSAQRAARKARGAAWYEARCVRAAS